MCVRVCCITAEKKSEVVFIALFCPSTLKLPRLDE